MNSGLLQVLVEEDFGYKREGRNWGRAEQHSSLVVNEETQKWYWNAEERGGGVLEYLLYVRGLNKKAAQEILDTRGRILTGSFNNTEEERTFVPQECLVEIMWELGKGNRDYWYSRKLTDQTIDRKQLGFYDGWSLLPLYNPNGHFVNFQMRRDEPKKFIKYWYRHSKPQLLNPELLMLVDTIFMTEGTIDSILLNQEGIPAVAHSGGSSYWDKEWFSLFSRIKTIYYIADNDSAGRGAAKLFANSLGIYRTKIFMFEDKKETYDTVDYFRDGGNAKDFKKEVEDKSRYLFEIGELNGNTSKSRKHYENWIGY